MLDKSIEGGLVLGTGERYLLLKRKNKRPACLQGNWNSSRAAIARKVEEFPALSATVRGRNEKGEEYDESRIALELKSSKPMVNMMHKALILGAIIPTKERLAEATAAGVDIPLDPSEDRQTEVVKPETDTETVVVDLSKQSQTVIAETPKLPPEPTPEAPQLSKLQMKEEMDKFVEGVNDKAAKILQPPPPPGGNGKTEDIKKPLLDPDSKPWHKITDPPKAEQPKVEPPVEAKPLAEEPKKEPKSDKMTVGGGLFESVHKVKLDLHVLVWFYYNKNVHGFKGTLDEFLNWCVADCVKARGLSLEIVEDPLGLIGAGLKDQMQQKE